MRRFAITTIVLLGVAAPRILYAQTAPPAAATPAQAAQPAAQPTAQQPAAPAPSDASDVSRSLFEPTTREFFVGGRFSNIDGDPARFQRYQDMRDGLLFSNVRYAFANPDGTWNANVFADNVGWRDQDYRGGYERTGKFSVTGSWQQIPQFYSVDTQTPYTGSGGTLLLDDATQQAIQAGQAKLSAYEPLAPQFELRERRDIGQIG